MGGSDNPKWAPVRWHTGGINGGVASDPVGDRQRNAASEIPLAALIDVETLRHLLDDLSALVGIATALLDLEGRILQSAGWQAACTGFHRAFPASCANCTESDLFLASHLRKGEFVDYKCRNGLWDVVTPIFVGDRHLGNLYCGQFFYDDDVVDEGLFLGQARRWGYDEAAYLAAVRALPRVSRDRVRKVMALMVGLASCVSTLSLANLRLSESRGQLEVLLNALPDPVWLKDTDGVFLACNRAFERLLGSSAAEIVGRTDRHFFDADVADRFVEKDREVVAAGEPRTHEEWIPGGQDGARLVETVKAPLPGAGGGTAGVLGIARDITERKRVEDNLRLMATVFSNSGEAILICDAANRILAVNREFTRLTGYSQDDIAGRNPSCLSAGNTPPEVYEEMWAALAARDYWQGELWDRRKSGEPYPKRLSVSVVRDGEGRVANYIGIFQDISARKAAEDEIRFLAHHDALTGLPNRLNLVERMGQGMAFARRTGKAMAVILIDLDRFKSINDTLGHNVGDQLLVEVAQRLRLAVRETDVVARLGGDEFVIVLNGVQGAADVADIADGIVAGIATPVVIAGNELRTSPSLGICLYPEDGGEINDLLKNADIAMYRAKAGGRGCFRFFSAQMLAEVSERVAVEKDLEAALRHGQFVLHYQPQVDWESGRVVGVEALVRWQHPIRGLVPPVDFIGLAEESGLIVPLGRWVLEEACRQLACWRAEGLSELHMAVNLSALQFQDASLPQRVAEALASTGVPARLLHLEITESVAMRNPADSIVLMRALTDLGVGLAIDDFGTGYSSLAYLRLFPIDIVKIDRSFVQDVACDQGAAAICEITLLLAHKLGKRVVAEGVETDAQLGFLAGIGCRWFQGYRFSRPLAPAAARRFIEEFAAR